MQFFKKLVKKLWKIVTVDIWNDLNIDEKISDKSLNISF